MSGASHPVWLTARDVQNRLKISRSAAFALMRQLPRLKMGKILRVRAADLQAFVASNMLPARQGPNALQRERAKARADSELALLLPRSSSTSRRPPKPTQPRVSAQGPIAPRRERER